MHPSATRPATRRLRPPPHYRRHPTGRARRRWPRAYDGGTGEPRPDRRYARGQSADHERERRRTRRQGLLNEMRKRPFRNGLIGLAVAGTAAPLAVNSYQQALRTNPDHERSMTQTASGAAASDDSVAGAWSAMESTRSSAAGARERVVSRKLAEYAEYGLTREMAEDIYDMALSADVSPDVAFGLVRAESSFKNQATSRVGAVGLTQLMPSTARWLEPGITQSELRDPSTNLRIGFGYLRQLTEKYGGDENLALIAYNRGPGTVDRILKRGGNPDNGYAGFVRTGDVGNHEG